MRNFLLFAIALLTAGCAFQEPYIIAQPPGPSEVMVQPAPPVVVQSGKPVVVAPASQGQAPAALAPPQVEVWRPDPTAGLIQNYSRNVFVRGWIDSRPPAPPTFELGPEQAVPINVFLGGHTLYAEGWITTSTYGRVSVGTMSRTFEIRNWSSNWGGYAWRVDIGDGDFRR